jgi:hypothetical protein
MATAAERWETGAAERPSLTHPFAMALRSGSAAPRARSDAVHFFMLLHAPPPVAPQRAAMVAPHDRWLAAFASRFEDERRWIADCAARSIPPRPDLALTRQELALRQQRQALLALAGLERPGTALGAMAALAADWPYLRAALDGSDTPAFDVPDLAADRAVAFGMAQLAAIHHAVWDIVEARQGARLPR